MYRNQGWAQEHETLLLAHEACVGLGSRMRSRQRPRAGSGLGCSGLALGSRTAVVSSVSL